MKTIISEKNAACTTAAEKFAELLAEKKDACLAFSFPDLPGEFFDALVRLYEAGKADFSEAKIFSAGEFLPGETLGKMLWEKFLSRVNVRRENCFLLNEESFGTYEEKIASCGGLDLIVLGLGEGCQLGFNEAGTPFSSLTHIQKLSDAFRKTFISLFGEEDKIPKKAMTLGIKSITKADKILVLAFGKDKAEALHRMLYARNDPASPAAFLQLPADVTVYADPAAASHD